MCYAVVASKLGKVVAADGLVVVGEWVLESFSWGVSDCEG